MTQVLTASSNLFGDAAHADLFPLRSRNFWIPYWTLPLSHSCGSEQTLQLRYILQQAKQLKLIHRPRVRRHEVRRMGPLQRSNLDWSFQLGLPTFHSLVSCAVSSKLLCYSIAEGSAELNFLTASANLGLSSSRSR